jgi:hypothetical protein
MAFEDLAADRVKEIQDAIYKELSDESQTSEEAQELLNLYSQLYQKIRYEWRPEDQNSLAQLRAAATTVIASAFSDVGNILDNFYESFRVIKKNTLGFPILDDENRWMWEIDELGKYKEDFSQLNGQDIEKAIFDLQRTKMKFSQSVSELFLEAVFAHYSFKDEFNERYEAMLEGTVGDRTARANRDTRESKYFAFFRYYLWQRAVTFEKEVAELMRILERIRQWRILELKDQ